MTEPCCRKLGILLATVLLAGASAAHAGPQNDIVRPISPGELQTLQSRQQRQNFQQRQQINRELDSMAIQRQPRLEVPVMKPRCPLQTSGTARTC